MKPRGGSRDEGTRDGAYGHRRDFGGDLFEKFELYWDRSPLKYAKNVKTPTLILVGDRDGEVPVEQSVEWWHALKAMHVPVKFVVYPNEGHVFVKPSDWQDYFQRSLEWFDEGFGKTSPQP